MLQKKLLAIIVFTFTFFIIRTVFALEVSWPAIPGAPTLSDNSSIGDFTIYSYAFFVAIGTLIAVIVLIVAGVELIITHNIAKAKPRIIGSLIGILVLVVPYSLLGLINPQLLKPATSGLSCEKSRVCINRYINTIAKKFIVKDGKTEESTEIDEKNIEELSLNSMAKISEEKTTVTKTGDEEKTVIIEKKQKITIKKFKGLQNIIGFSEENYGGTATIIFKDSSNNDNLDKDIPSDIIISSEEYKSFKVVTKTAQMYFYDKPNYEVDANAPLSTTVGFYDLTKKTINSIDIVNPYSTNIDYIGLMFNDAGYKTKCAVFYEDIPDIKNDVFLKKANGGSLKIYSRNKEYLTGSKIVLTLYNNTSCAERISSTEKDIWKQNKKCEITLIGNNEDIPDPSTDTDEDVQVKATCDKDKYNCRVTLKSTNTIAFPKNISKVCPNIGGAYSIEDVFSFRIDSSGVVVFLDKNNTCNVWELLRVGEGESDCNRVNSTGLNPDSSFRPYKFFVIPYGGNITGDIETASHPACGDASFKEFDSAPTTDLCNPGTPSTVSGTGPWTWTCSNEGQTTSCSTQTCSWTCGDWSECIDGEQTRSCISSSMQCKGNPNPTSQSCIKKINGVCGKSNGKEFDSAPTIDLCETGTASAVSGTGPWTWTCKGIDGGKNDECLTSASTRCECGASNGKKFKFAPTTDLCDENCSSSGVLGGGPWTWTCEGEEDDQESISCSAKKILPIDGRCATVSASFAPPTTGLCEQGTPTAVKSDYREKYPAYYNGNWPYYYWTWTCEGYDNGSSEDGKSVDCETSQIIYAQCGRDAPDGQTKCGEPTSCGVDVCKMGYCDWITDSDIEDPFEAWSCRAYNKVECGINDQTNHPGNNTAKCGTAKGQLYPNGIPSDPSLLCDYSGTPIIGKDSWNWSCLSKYGTSSVFCSAAKNN
ncbi:MAG: hypothetical protein WC472_01235 [Candidatus Paceibacterota bacterium]